MLSRKSIISSLVLLAVLVIPFLPPLFLQLASFSSSIPGPSSPADIVPQRRAYATFLDSSSDAYYNAVRVLAYQLLHNPETRTSLDIPLLVFAAGDLSEEKRRNLSTEGTTVVLVDQPQNSTTHRQYSKLSLFNMTQYDRILYMSSDILLTRPLDRVWTEPAGQRVQRTRRNATSVHIEEGPLPHTYLFAGMGNKAWNDDLNPEFWMIRPDTILFEYYRSLLSTGRDDLVLEPQRLLDYAHRAYGNMPRATFPAHWGTGRPTIKDLAGGYATLHHNIQHANNVGLINRKLVEMWWAMQDQMDVFWQGVKEDN